jgi:hypothetical protein
MIHTIDRPHVFCHVCGRDGRTLAVLALNYAADGRVAEDAGRSAFVCGECLRRAILAVAPAGVPYP